MNDDASFAFAAHQPSGLNKSTPSQKTAIWPFG
jgi:hypothetical protein